MLNLTVKDKYELYIGFVIMVFFSIIKLKILGKNINMFEIIISVFFILFYKIVRNTFMREVEKQLNKNKNKNKNKK